MQSVKNQPAQVKNNLPPIKKILVRSLQVAIGIYGIAFAGKSMHAISYRKNSCDLNKINPTNCLHIISYLKDERDWPTDGHSLFSISIYKPGCPFSEKDNHIIYETGPKGFRNNSDDSFFVGGELLIKKNSWFEKPTEAKRYAIRSAPLDACDMQHFKKLIENLIALKYAAWSPLNNCAQLTRDIWLAVVGEKIWCNPHWACIPLDLFKAIENKNKAFPK